MAKKKRAKLRVIYNAPVTLTFSIATVILLTMNQLALNGLVSTFFMVPGKIGSEIPFDWTNPLNYLLLFTHVLGHSDWNHLLGNISFILLLGPLLEERYGSPMLTLMIAITALVTGVLNVCFIPRPMLGASGVAFMMILLSSFTAISKHQIPLTFLLVLVLFMGRELATGFQDRDVASLAHIMGGLCGSLFGFLTAHSPRSARARRAAPKPAPGTPAGTRTESAAKPSGGGADAAGKSAPARKTASRQPKRDDTFDIYTQEATILFGDEEGLG